MGGAPRPRIPNDLTRLSRAKRVNFLPARRTDTYFGTTVWDDYRWAGATRRSEGQGLGGGSQAKVFGCLLIYHPAGLCFQTDSRRR